MTTSKWEEFHPVPFLQEANAAENLRAQRGYFEGEFGKGRVPLGVIRKQQTARREDVDKLGGTPKACAHRCGDCRE